MISSAGSFRQNPKLRRPLGGSSTVPQRGLPKPPRPLPRRASRPATANTSITINRDREISSTVRLGLEVCQLWILPIVGFWLAWHLWQGSGLATETVTLLMLAPVFVMMGVVVWGTQMYEGWGFPVASASKGCPLQIGFTYATSLQPFSVLRAPLLGFESPSLGVALFESACGIAGGAIGCLYDYSTVRYNLLWIFIGRFRSGERPAAVVAV